ncbi:MAG TPA: tetratricopeptide repeat protein, partial [Ktedonobacterales bacterium]|nr:tetratricopeptide repeat protein [Ktedonobacterales bacterium]
NPEVQIELAETLATLDEREGARQAFERARALVPSSNVILQLYGAALLRWGEYAEAERHLRMALARRSGFVAARLSLATLLEETGRPEDALHELESCADLDPDDEDVHLALALALERRGENQRAEVEARRAASLNPRLLDAVALLARLDPSYSLRPLPTPEEQRRARIAALPTRPLPALPRSTEEDTDNSLHEPGAPAPVGAHGGDTPVAPAAPARPGEQGQQSAIPTTFLRSSPGTSDTPDVSDATNVTNATDAHPIATLVEEAAQAPQDGAAELATPPESRRSKRRKEKAARPPKAERTRRPGWLTRLFHWGR